MKKDVLSGVCFLAVTAVVFCLMGCMTTSAKSPAEKTAVATVKSMEKVAAVSRAQSLGEYLRALASSPATGDVAKAMDGLVNAGIGFFILGAFVMIFGSKTAGWNIIGMGTLMLAAGVLFMSYPWVVLCLAAIVGLVALVNAFDQWRNRKSLDATRQQLEEEHSVLKTVTGVIQNLPEGSAIKAGISALGDCVEQKVRGRITPVKEELKAEGVIA